MRNPVFFDLLCLLLLLFICMSEKNLNQYQSTEKTISPTIYVNIEKNGTVWCNNDENFTIVDESKILKTINTTKNLLIIFIVDANIKTGYWYKYIEVIKKFNSNNKQTIRWDIQLSKRHVSRKTNKQ